MTNWAGIRHLSIEKNLNVPEVLIDSDREKNCASNEPILSDLNRIFMDFQVKNWFWNLPESPSDVCYYPMSFKK